MDQLRKCSFPILSSYFPFLHFRLHLSLPRTRCSLFCAWDSLMRLRSTIDIASTFLPLCSILAYIFSIMFITWVILLLTSRVFSNCSLDRSLLVVGFRSYTFLVFSILIDNRKRLGLVHISTLVKKIKTQDIVTYEL